jgi:hypothetical protein
MTDKRLQTVRNIDALYALANHGALWNASVRVEELKKECPNKDIADFMQDVENRIDALRADIMDTLGDLNLWELK